ncbi:MAG: class I SAM-dependent methyltransferase, partial [Gammaproteobacteria bacterium]
MSGQRWNAQTYRRYAAFVPNMAESLVECLRPMPGETILDLGCGDGRLTASIRERGCRVVGIDADADMIAAAREHGLEAFEIDARQLPYRDCFDAVFSNAALHWIKDAKAAIDRVYAALKPGGHFVGEFGGTGNVRTLVEAIGHTFDDHPEWGPFVDPWFFPSVSEYKTLLEQGGFEVLSIERFERPTPLPDGVGKWLEVFAQGIARGLDAERKVLFFRQVEAQVQAELYSERDGWYADYVRLRFSA